MNIELFNVFGLEFVFKKVLRAPYEGYSNGDGGSEADYRLMHSLATQVRDSHSKFMRFIIAQYSITASMYFWKQFDTYKVGNDVMSESSMNRMRSRDFKQADFSYVSEPVLRELNHLRNAGEFGKVSDLLPMGYLQTRHIQSSYQALRNMYEDRCKHRLSDWREFCSFVERLPYSDLLTRRMKNANK